MQGFDAVILPAQMAAAVRRETHFRTDIVATASGDEHRNAGWSQARHQFTLDAGAVTLDEARALELFFRARAGRHRGFLVPDWLHPHTGVSGDIQAQVSAGDVVLHAADAARRVFHIDIEGRRNMRPRADGFLLAQNGQGVGPRDFTLDVRHARLEMTRAIPADVTLTAGFHFDVAVRFDVDRLDMQRVSADMVQVAPLALVEINLPRAAL